MWPFTSTEQFLQAKILSKNIVDNIQNDLTSKEMSKESRERKLIILESLQYYYSL